jgi:hypothetical protein
MGAKIYARKPINAIGPKKPVGPEQAMGEDETMGQAFQVQQSGPQGTTLVNPQTKVQMQLPAEMSAALVPNKDDPKQFTLSQQAVTPTAGAEPNKPAGPQAGDTVTIAGPTMGEDGDEAPPPEAPTDGGDTGGEVAPEATDSPEMAAESQRTERGIRTESKTKDDELLSRTLNIAGLR